MASVFTFRTNFPSCWPLDPVFLPLLDQELQRIEADQVRQFGLETGALDGQREIADSEQKVERGVRDAAKKDPLTRPN